MSIKVGDRVKVKDKYFELPGGINNNLRYGNYGTEQHKHKNPEKGQYGTVVNIGKGTRVHVNFSDREPDNPDNFGSNNYLTISTKELKKGSDSIDKIKNNYNI